MRAVMKRLLPPLVAALLPTSALAVQHFDDKALSRELSAAVTAQLLEAQPLAPAKLEALFPAKLGPYARRERTESALAKTAGLSSVTFRYAKTSKPGDTGLSLTIQDFSAAPEILMSGATASLRVLAHLPVGAGVPAPRVVRPAPKVLGVESWQGLGTQLWVNGRFLVRVTLPDLKEARTGLMATVYKALPLGQLARL